MNCEMVDTYLLRSFMFQEKTTWVYSQIADVIMLNDV